MVTDKGMPRCWKFVHSSVFPVSMSGLLSCYRFSPKWLMIPNCPFTLRSESTEELVWSSRCKGGSSFGVSRQSEWYAAFSLISYCQRNNLDVWPYSLVKFLREALLIFCLKADWGCKYLEVYIKTLDCVVSFPAEVSFWLFLGQAPRMSLVSALPHHLPLHNSTFIFQSAVTDSCPCLFIFVYLPDALKSHF